jgi:hypothetical protein
MNEYAWISLIALTGWLVLALGSYRAHRIGARKSIVMGLAWIAIFLLATGIFAAIER